MRGRREIVPKRLKRRRPRGTYGEATRATTRERCVEEIATVDAGKTHLTRACVNITDVRARERSLRSRAALAPRAPPRLGVAAAKTGFPFLGKLFVQRERGPGVVHGGVLAALNV